MSTQRSLRVRVRSLRELRDVFDAMRNLARAEISKLVRTQGFRHRLLDELSAVAASSVPYFPAPLASSDGCRNLYLVIGSERGLCGDFNGRIAARWAALDATMPEGDVLVVGSALAARFPLTRRRVVPIPGPATIDDVDSVLVAVLRQIAEESAEQAIGLIAIAADRERVRKVEVLPFAPPQTKRGVPPPRLMLPPETFVRGFVDQYVDAALHEVFATSMLAEQQERLARMTLAVDRVDHEVATTKRRANRLRQEAITQEVETLLLSASSSPFDDRYVPTRSTRMARKPPLRKSAP